MRRLVYETPGPRPRAELARALSSADTKEVCEALVAAALHEPDWRWVQGECVRLSTSAHPEIRALVPTCLGHIVRIHGALDVEIVEPVLTQLAKDQEARVVGRVQDALDDIAQFMGERWRRS